MEPLPRPEAGTWNPKNRLRSWMMIIKDHAATVSTVGHFTFRKRNTHKMLPSFHMFSNHVPLSFSNFPLFLSLSQFNFTTKSGDLITLPETAPTRKRSRILRYLKATQSTDNRRKFFFLDRDWLRLRRSWYWWDYKMKLGRPRRPGVLLSLFLEENVRE